MINVAINGFGRIGRMVFRAGYKDKQLNFVAVNDLTDTKTLAQLLKYDSVHGKFPEEISYTNDSLIIGKKKIRVFAEKDPGKLPWKDLKVEVVVESTGFFCTQEAASAHLQAGAKKVILSADAKDATKTIILGANEKTYNKKADSIISMASCTSNCTAPMVKVIQDSFGIETAFFTTTHAYTATQKLHDAPDKNLRNARAANVNIIPHFSGAAKAVPLTVPEVKGNFEGMALRVPVIDGSITVLTSLVKKKTNTQEVNSVFKKAAQTSLKGILQYSNELLVSSDIIGNPYSCIFDSEFTKVNGRLVQVLGWYDNEWGYSCRMVDMIKFIYSK
ncbi:MAG TPA: type I glyceraldehyde-3-phosphate dehydrogenase [Candidatus Nanoarchaeia archaeon]|nr:type I glyceraldehyde-3-phosphate dehydrogenase [Candidatus Nanoarchaeia archaeon]